jgi:2-oxoisovalerate dehydrogenase E1 component alpha subunit
LSRELAARGPALGIPTVRIDGNDVLANFMATAEARRICLEESRPVLIEAMTYRVSHHSTSDDSTAYRSVDEVRNWTQNDHPIVRLKKLLLKRNWFSEEDEHRYKEEARKEMMAAVVRAEKVMKPSVESMFTDVYEELPDHLRDQYRELCEHVEAYREHYPMGLFDSADSREK